METIEPVEAAENLLMMQEEEPLPETPGNEKRNGCIVVSCSLFILTIFSATGGFAVGSVVTHKMSGTTEAVARMTLYSNTSADFCSDAWEFTCGNFEDTHYKVGSAISTFQRKINSHVLDMLTEEKSNSVMTNFFNSCLQAAYMNETKKTRLWMWQRGIENNNITFGWSIDPTDIRRSHAYVAYNGGDSLVPEYVRGTDNTTCSNAIFDVIRKVIENMRIETVMVFGDHASVCAALSEGIEEEETTIDAEALDESTCLSYTSMLWPGALSMKSLAIEPALNSSVIVDVFTAIQTEYVNHLTLNGYTALAEKVSNIKCNVVYSAPQEVYEPVYDAFEYILEDYLHQKFVRETHATSVEFGWDMEATAVNAYYSLLENTINILPAMAMFVYESRMSQAFLYGRLGYIIGHEIAHSIDANGILFDENGRYHNETILTSDQLENFEEDKLCFSREYNTGGRTTNEDIADQVGLRVAKKVADKKQPGASLRICADTCVELTKDAQFYTYFAQTWCSAYKSKVYDNDVHSANKERVVHLLDDMNAQVAFSCPDATPKKRCSIFNF